MPTNARTHTGEQPRGDANSPAAKKPCCGPQASPVATGDIKKDRPTLAFGTPIVPK